MTPPLFDYQQAFIDDIVAEPFPQRACLYYKTGAGKSLTAVLGLRSLGYRKALVICPPSTHSQWINVGGSVGMEISVMSHAMFRMPGTKVDRQWPIIADEFHLFGGQQGKGWRKLDTMAAHLQAPLFLLSATPNYNDAERCYCVQHILDPLSCRGGFLQFVYQHCVTEQNPFGQMPKVLGFSNHPDAASYLSSLPKVHYLPDDLVYTIDDIEYTVVLDHALTHYGFNARTGTMVASPKEMEHTVILQGLINGQGRIQGDVWSTIADILLQNKKVLIFAQHSTVIEALARTMQHTGCSFDKVTGQTSTKMKGQIIGDFIAGKFNILLGTASLATGTDGLDRVCDTLLILDDTDDDAMRRQLIGRIMPRGAVGNASNKQVLRMVPNIT